MHMFQQTDDHGTVCYIFVSRFNFNYSVLDRVSRTLSTLSPRLCNWERAYHCYKQMAILSLLTNLLHIPCCIVGKVDPNMAPLAEVQLFTMAQTVLLHGPLEHNHFISLAYYQPYAWPNLCYDSAAPPIWVLQLSLCCSHYLTAVIRLVVASVGMPIKPESMYNYWPHTVDF